MLNERSIAERLTAMGFNATVVEEWNDMTDGEVYLEGTDFHVQVGENYLILVEDNRRSNPKPEEYWTAHVKSWSNRVKFFAEVGSFLAAAR